MPAATSRWPRPFAGLQEDNDDQGRPRRWWGPVKVLPGGLDAVGPSLGKQPGQQSALDARFAQAAGSASGCPGIASTAFARMQQIWHGHLVTLNSLTSMMASDVTGASASYVQTDSSQMGITGIAPAGPLPHGAAAGPGPWVPFGPVTRPG
ncbi:MAG: hypothetical protein ACYDH5_09845 [Acidimicrobiales bacterium]